MTKDEALKLALEALEAHADIGIKSDKAITAIKQALAAPVQPVAFLANGTRFKISYDSRQSGGQIHGIPPELGGQWVALVAAEDDCHLKLATPPAAPVQEPTKLKPEDVIVETYSTQKGGFVLKPDNGVRLIHKPTGIVMQCASERSQHRNRDQAWRDLERYLYGARPQPAAQRQCVGLTEREIELLDGMIAVQLDHAARCDGIANRTMAEKQKGWDMERVALLQKLKKEKS